MTIGWATALVFLAGCPRLDREAWDGDPECHLDVRGCRALLKSRPRRSENLVWRFDIQSISWYDCTREEHTTMTARFIPYYRVSTKRQGRSGLGLEAQQMDVLKLIAESQWQRDRPLHRNRDRKEPRSTGTGEGHRPRQALQCHAGGRQAGSACPQRRFHGSLDGVEGGLRVLRLQGGQHLDAAHLGGRRPGGGATDRRADEKGPGRRQGPRREAGLGPRGRVGRAASICAASRRPPSGRPRNVGPRPTGSMPTWFPS